MSNIKTNVSRQYSRGSLFQAQPVEQPIQQQSSDNVSFTINDVYEHDGNVPTQNNPQLHPLDSLTADNYKHLLNQSKNPNQEADHQKHLLLLHMYLAAQLKTSLHSKFKC